MTSPDYSLLGPVAQLSNVNQNVQQTLLGQQQIEQNQNALAQQDRAQLAQKALGVATDPNADPAARQQAMQVVQANDPQTAMAIRLQQQGMQALNEHLQRPTAVSAMRALALNPSLKEAITSGMSGYNDAAAKAKVSLAGDVVGFLSGPTPDVTGAANAIMQHYQADKEAGLPVDGYEQILTAVHTNPQAALGLAHLMIAGANPEKIGENAKALAEAATSDATRPADVATAQATAAIKGTEAQYAPAVAQSGLQTAAAQRERMATQNATDIVNANVAKGRLVLDTNKLAADTQVAMAGIEEKYGELPGDTEKLVNEAASQAASTQQIAQRERALASEIRNAGLHSGPGATAAERFKAFWGTQDRYTQMRNEYMQLKNQGMLASGKGVFARITNADLKLLNQGFPPANADPKFIANFLDTMARTHDAIAQQNDDKATWAAANRGLGPARRPIVIDGIKYPPGTTFMQQQAARARMSAPDLPGDAQNVVARARGQ